MCHSPLLIARMRVPLDERLTVSAAVFTMLRKRKEQAEAEAAELKRQCAEYDYAQRAKEMSVERATFR